MTAARGGVLFLRVQSLRQRPSPNDATQIGDRRVTGTVSERCGGADGEIIRDYVAEGGIGRPQKVHSHGESKREGKGPSFVIS